MSGENSPAAHSAAYGTVVSFGAGRPLSVVNLVASSRTVNAGLVGTRHGCPPARSRAATTTSVLATSAIDVQLWGTSRAAGTYARLRADSGAARAKVKIE